MADCTAAQFDAPRIVNSHGEILSGSKRLAGFSHTALHFGGAAMDIEANEATIELPVGLMLGRV